MKLQINILKWALPPFNNNWPGSLFALQDGTVSFANASFFINFAPSNEDTVPKILR